MTDATVTVAENTGFKGILVTLFQRIILSYKSTLIGIAVMAVGYFVDLYANSPNKLVSTIAGVVGAVLLFYKEKVPAPAPAP